MPFAVMIDTFGVAGVAHGATRKCHLWGVRRRLRLPKIREPKPYSDGLNGFGLDVECQALRDLSKEP